MPSPVKMTAVSGSHLTFRENAVLFSLFYQKQTYDPNQVILGHWWVHVQPSFSFRGLPWGSAQASEAAGRLSQADKLGGGGPLEINQEAEGANSIKVSPKKARALGHRQLLTPTRVQLTRAGLPWPSSTMPHSLNRFLSSSFSFLLFSLYSRLSVPHLSRPQLTICILAQGRIKWVNESSLTTLKLITRFCVSPQLNRMKAETSLFA